jgi:hypothetical protein
MPSKEVSGDVLITNEELESITGSITGRLNDDTRKTILGIVATRSQAVRTRNVRNVVDTSITKDMN